MTQSRKIPAPRAPEAPEDGEPFPSGPEVPHPGNKALGRASLHALDRNVSQKESSSPAIRKMLQDDVDRLEAEKAELIVFRTAFYKADKDAEVLRTRLTSSIGLEVLTTGCATVGGALIGWAPSLAKDQSGTAILLSAVAVVLLVAAVVAKKMNK
ncbi:hypothetical protein [Pseudoxanthomonas winnipegensis]|uniref:DUF2335 domain-containing protein n=1 Tax=Pseudoxanthomonas winnipegensis TaxID=2480810 RepID=A0A4Q8M663_9GAMM|nr:hypothetical protein [Pseudoxanthomonas winnipegensis]TAA42543.1 hypothetical protein EA655_11050 [Pseudoxanthomonas winnipegensis]